MNNANDGGPAFPMPGMSGLPNDGFIYGQDGMTLRDYFAAKAMAAFIHRAERGTSFGVSHKETNLSYSTASYAMADAMLKAREK